MDKEGDTQKRVLHTFNIRYERKEFNMKLGDPEKSNKTEYLRNKADNLYQNMKVCGKKILKYTARTKLLKYTLGR